jgi:proline dehydrogenase
VFRLCTFKPLVKNAKTLLDFSNKVLGKSLTSFVIKHTFFAHFCAGEDEAEIQPTIQRLRASGIGAILDFAAESDVAPEKNNTNKNKNTSLVQKDNSTVTSLLEEDSIVHKKHLKDNFEHSLLGVELAGRALMNEKGTSAKPGSGFSAIKLTSFARPELLMLVTSILRKHEDAFDTLALASKTTPDSAISCTAFVQAIKATPAGKELTETQLQRIFSTLDSSNDGVLDKIEFTDALSILAVGPLEHAIEIEQAASSLEKLPQPLLTLLGLDEGKNESVRNEWAEVNDRMSAIAEAAEKGKVSVMVDAEQTYLQLAINSVTMKAQQRFNRPISSRSLWVDPSLAHVRALISNKSNLSLPSSQQQGDVQYAVVYTTLQAYLVAAPDRLNWALKRSQRENFIFGAKLVRGAYMIQERKRAIDFGYVDPIQKTIQDTHECYDTCAETLARASLSGRACVMAATHNEASVMKLVSIMKSLAGDTSNISFGQLLGMCDYVSFSLGAAHISVHKYVPYGPVLEVVPYLIRRAQENSDILGGVGKELRLIQDEVSRRMFNRK